MECEGGRMEGRIDNERIGDGKGWNTSSLE